MNNISLGYVVDRTDYGQGTFTASIYAEMGEEVPVIYTSPYASNTKGAFLAIPEKGVEILVVQPHGSQNWYYLGSTFLPERDFDALKEPEYEGSTILEAKKTPTERVDPNLSRARGLPAKINLKGPTGAGLTISDEYNPKFFNKKVELTTPENKKVSLIDSPKIDSVFVDSGKGSKIIVTGEPERSYPKHAVRVDTIGPQQYINRQSQTDVVIGKGGRELQLINTANGVEWGDAARCGNVNIQSNKEDINVFTKEESGDIFIECLNPDGSEDQVIQLKVNGDGSINLVANKIRLLASESLDLKSDGSFTVKADTIKMEATGAIDIGADGNVSIDGDKIDLANGFAEVNVDYPIKENKYGNQGVRPFTD
jgi:hypothetical protein